MNLQFESHAFRSVAAPAIIMLLAFDLFGQSATYDDLLTRAKSALAAKNYTAATIATQQAFQMDDRRWEAYAIAANAYSGQQLYDDAIGMLQMALSRAPEERKQLVRNALQEVRSLSSAPSAQKPTTATNSPISSAPAATQQEIVLWKSIESSTKTENFESYLRAYPSGTYAQLAKDHIAAIREAQEKLPGSLWIETSSNQAISHALRFSDAGMCYESLRILGGMRMAKKGPSGKKVELKPWNRDCSWHKNGSTIEITQHDGANDSCHAEFVFMLKGVEMNGSSVGRPIGKTGDACSARNGITFHRSE